MIEIKAKLLNILLSPDSKTALTFDKESASLVDQEQRHFYRIEEGVPVLLPENAREKVLQAEQHVRENTSFRYVDHYQVDAEAFDYYEAFEDAASIHATRRLHEAILAEIPRGARNVLDVGCGNAWVAQSLCPKGVEVYSLDVSTVNPVKALKKHPFDNHYAITGDVYALPIKPDTFDCIIAAEIIEHVPDPRKFIDCLIQVLRPGGSLVISTPYNEKLKYSLCIHCNRPTPENAHIHSFDEKKILSLVPPGQAESAITYAFANKALIMLRTHVLLKSLNFRLWRLVDKLSNKILNKPSRLLLKVIKST